MKQPLTSPKKDRTPAFPLEQKSRNPAYSVGMELRDWFAGQIIQTLVRQEEEHCTYDEAVERAYEMADKMMQERLK